MVADRTGIEIGRVVEMAFRARQAISHKLTDRIRRVAWRRRNVGAADTCREIEKEVDETVCAMAPEWFQAVGQFYEDFSQTSDDEVRELLARAARRD